MDCNSEQQARAVRKSRVVAIVRSSYCHGPASVEVADVTCFACDEMYRLELALAIVKAFSGAPSLCRICSKDRSPLPVTVDGEQEERRVAQIIYEDERDADFNDLYNRQAEAEVEERKMRLAEQRAKEKIEESYYSKEEGCMVTSVPCDDCGWFFLLEVGYVVLSITSDEKFICAKCDPESKFSTLASTGVLPWVTRVAK